MRDLKNPRIEYSMKVVTKDIIKASTDLNKAGAEPIIADLYALRGITSFEEMNLRQQLEPFTNMLNTTKAAEILAQYIEEGKKLCIVADYDVDGATACSIGVLGLRMFGANISYVVPNRFIHGYGLTNSVVDEAIKRESPDLIITVDNGVSSVEGVAHAKNQGVEVLVTDHHLAGENLPDAICIVNPNQPACTFKNKSLAGCGVIWYVLCVLRDYYIKSGKYNEKNAPNINSLIDLVAIGTVADVVKLELNNRILVNAGLSMIRKGKTRPGVLALIEECKRTYYKLNTMDIGFSIGPRLNAAGRLEDMSIGINCLLSTDEVEAKSLAKKLNQININRKELELGMREEALELPSLKETEYSKVAFSETFHEGVIGIVASRIKDQFYRPTIVFAPAEHEGHIKGSGRSIPEVHLRDALDYVYKKKPEIMVKFGGHAMAAGLTINKEYLEDFCILFEESVAYLTKGMELKNKKEIDMDLPVDFINIETAESINMNVWGQGFAQPLFMGNFNIIRQDVLKDSHLKLVLEKEGVEIEAIWFFNPTPLDSNDVNLVYTLSVNEFNGRKKIQLLVDGAYL
jgi:single-stranded-DNA-specific exonuclease